MEKLEPIGELFAYPEQAFSEHLKLPYNHRILFSGRYGIGKTTFLDYFFSNGEKAEQYNAVHIFPVNYQIARNEDILEYIKYDIIAHLLSVEEIEFEKSDLPSYQVIPLLLANRPADVLSPLLHFFGGAGKVYENWKKLLDEVYEEHKSLQINEKQKLLDYLENAGGKTGSIYENDFYTKLISNLLLRWKEVNTAKNILIIDDLDRIDPQHAFRLFNIFSAHFDHKEEQLNKFGFDKVIFVCDLQNIRNIFAHNYGTNVDFSGYIDKFYSKQVFKFDSKNTIDKMIGDWVKAFHFEGQNDHHTSQLKNDKRLYDNLTMILKTMVLTNAINLRSLLKFREASLRLNENKKILISSSSSFYNWQQFIVMFMDILVQFVGTPEDLMIALNKCEKHDEVYRDDSLNREWILKSVLALIGYREGKTHTSQSVEVSGFSFKYKVTYAGSTQEQIWAEVEPNENIKKLNIFTLYKEALKLLIDRGYY